MPIEKDLYKFAQFNWQELLKILLVVDTYLNLVEYFSDIIYLLLVTIVCSNLKSASPCEKYEIWTPWTSVGGSVNASCLIPFMGIADMIQNTSPLFLCTCSNGVQINYACINEWINNKYEWKYTQLHGHKGKTRDHILCAPMFRCCWSICRAWNCVLKSTKTV